MGSFRFDTENSLIIELLFRFASISLPLLLEGIPVFPVSVQRLQLDGIPVFPVSVRRLHLDDIPVSLFHYNDYNWWHPSFPASVQWLQLYSIPVSRFQYSTTTATWWHPCFPCFSTTTTTWLHPCFPCFSTTTTTDVIPVLWRRLHVMTSLFPCFSTMTTTGTGRCCTCRWTAWGRSCSSWWSRGRVSSILENGTYAIRGGQNETFYLWHFGYIHLGGGALILDRCRAFYLFASVDAHLCMQYSLAFKKEKSWKFVKCKFEQPLVFFA